MRPDPGQAAYYQSLWRFLLVVVLVFLVRSLWTFPVEHTDAMQKLYYAGEIVRTGEWRLLLTNHHTLRWAAMLPEIGLIKLLGHRYEVLILLPLLVFSLYWTLILFCLRRVLRPAALVLLGALLFIDPFGINVSNEFLISGLGILFAVTGACLLVNCRQSGHASILLAAILFFFAYGAHVTYLSFAAGGFFWLVLYHRSWPKGLTFVATLLVLLVFETLLFNALSSQELSLGRLEALAGGAHVDRILNRDTVRPVQLFTRWLALPLPHILLCLVFLASGLWYLMAGKNHSVPEIIKCLYLVGLSCALGVTFAVVSIDPLRPAMPLAMRYLIPFLPFTIIIAMTVGSRFIETLNMPLLRKIEFKVSLVTALALVVIPTLYIDFFRACFQGYFWTADQQYKEFSSAFGEGKLVFTGKGRPAIRMLVEFSQPVEVRYTNQGVHASMLQPGHKCVERLKRAPLALNYVSCNSTTEPQ